MDGNEWEIKCPMGDGKHTIARNFHNAAAQSHFIIFDLRRCKLPEKQSISQLKREFKLRKDMKRLLIISGEEKLIEIRK